jgi:hypothetical protein
MAKFNWGTLIVMIIVFALGFSLGAFWGVLKFVDHVGEAGAKVLNNVNLEVNIGINETLLINEFNKTVIPELQQKESVWNKPSDRCNSGGQCSNNPLMPGCRIVGCNSCCGNSCTNKFCIGGLL